MKKIFPFVMTLPFVVLIPQPALAEAPDSADTTEPGFSLMEQGARLFMRGLMAEMEPALDDMQTMMRDMGPELQGLIAEMGPALQGLLEQIDSLSNYEAPIILPNGDILLRRKGEAAPLDLGEVEL